VVFTNGTIRSGRTYAQILWEIGFPLEDSSVLTPASSAVDTLLRRGQRTVVVLGGAGLAEAGIEVLPPVGKPRADAVLVGWYRECTLENIEAACHAIWQGATLYSASQPVFFASAEGKILGTSRLICGAITSATGTRATVVGKPSPHALQAACRRLGPRPPQVAVIGDDPLLETPMARRGGAVAIAVDTGIGETDDDASLPAHRRPHLRLPGVDQLLPLIQHLNR
jgi:NagD protein